MLKNLLLSAVLALTATASASAVTVDDLCSDKYLVTHVICGSQLQYYNPIATGECKVVKVSDNKIKVTNFYGLCDLEMTISGNKASVANGYTNNNFSFYPASQTGYNWTYSGSWYVFKQESGAWSGTVNEVGDAANIEFNCGMMREAGVIVPDVFTQVFIVFTPKNAVQNWQKTNNDQGSNNCSVTLGDNTFTYNGKSTNYNLAIYNLAGIGYNYQSIASNTASASLHGYTFGTIDYATGNVTIPVQQVEGKEYWKSQGSWTTKNVNYSSVYGYWVDASTLSKTHMPHEIRSYKNNTVGSSTTAITGKYEATGAIHNNIDNYWTSRDGGKLTTNLGGKITLDPFCVYRTAAAGSYTVGVVGTRAFSKDEIVFNIMDVTADVALKVNKFGSSATEGVYVNATMTLNKTNEYVESFELYAVPGTVSNISSQTCDDTKGLSGAICLTQYATTQNFGADTKSIAAGTTKEFNALIPADKLTAQTDGKKYTFFVKVNYTAASGLHSTFHALNSIEPNVDMNAQQPFTVELDMTDKEESHDQYWFKGKINISGNADGIQQVNLYFVPGKMESEAQALEAIKDLEPNTWARVTSATSIINNGGCRKNGADVHDGQNWHTVIAAPLHTDGTETIADYVAMYHGVEFKQGNGWANHLTGGTHEAIQVKQKIVRGNPEPIAIEVENPDITHNVTLTNNVYGRGKAFVGDNTNYIFVQGTIDSGDNHHFVEHKDYELWLVEGWVRNISQYYSSIDQWNNLGVNVADHIRRIDLPEYYHAYIPSQAAIKTISGMSEDGINKEANSNGKYSLLVPMNSEDNGTQYQHTLFVKTNYKDGSFTTTSHALTALGYPTVTSITDITGDVVEEGEARFFDLQGREHKGTLAPGVYVKKVNGTATKVVVK